ncbi:MAG: hypothetical protein ACE5LS_06705 [Thermoplasmata archaeon]
MEAPKLSAKGQVVFATLLAIAVYAVLVYWIALAQVSGGPTVSAAYVGALFLVVSVILLPLVLWGQKSAYAGAIGLGAFGVIANILGIAGVFGALASESLVITVPILLVNLGLIWASWGAWKE